VFFMVLTLAAIGLPTTSGFTGEFLVLLGTFNAAWPVYQAGNSVPLVMAVIAVTGVVLGAMYMLWFAQRFLFGAVKAPHAPVTDLNGRERAILGRPGDRGILAWSVPERGAAQDRSGGAAVPGWVRWPASRRRLRVSSVSIPEAAR
jgi:NADH:ubiquinone oxidoreductase subunit 5 (subunit L)/multisubunit Na+/H+ antiporter MnhA subunit